MLIDDRAETEALLKAGGSKDYEFIKWVVSTWNDIFISLRGDLGSENGKATIATTCPNYVNVKDPITLLS